MYTILPTRAVVVEAGSIPSPGNCQEAVLKAPVTLPDDAVLKGIPLGVLLRAVPLSLLKGPFVGFRFGGFDFLVPSSCVKST